MDEDELVSDLNDLSLEEQVEREVQLQLEKGRTLLKEVETFAEYVQKLPRRDRVHFQHLRGDIQHDLRNLERVSRSGAMFTTDAFAFLPLIGL
jgi:hypothetical protein